MHKLILCLTLLSCCLCSPLPQTAETSGSSPSPGWLADFGDYGPYLSSAWESLPQSLKTYLEETVDKGQELAEDIYQDIQEEVFPRINTNLGELNRLRNMVVSQLGASIGTLLRLQSSEEPITEEESLEADAALEKLEVELKELDGKVSEEFEADARLPNSPQNQILKMITVGRSLLSLVNKGMEEFYNQRKLVQLQLYKIMDLLGDSTGELKNQIRDIIESIEQIDVARIGSADVPRELN